MTQNFILGYGSLIELESRTRTAENACDAYPVRVKNYMRGWFARTGGPGISCTYLGCIEKAGHHTNGVIYEVSDKELDATDEREVGYTKHKVDGERINHLSDFKIPKDAVVWIYLSDYETEWELTSKIPSSDCPIVQSYVDICVNGCIEIEEKFPLAKEALFAKNFIQSTQYWNNHWANDRIYPRRPFMYRKTAGKIDRLLVEHLLDETLFNQIYLE
jgi:hypothetical protein